MVINETSAAKVAEYLLQIKAIKLQPSNPFTWASGWKSPIYCDNRKTLSYPKIRTFIREEMVKTILEKYGKPDVIAGAATGGIAQGALVAQEMELPFIYVRSSPKAHGMTNLIEGVVEKGQKIVVIEDLISTGGSSLKAVEALRDFGCLVEGMVAIFSYGFDEAKNNFTKANTNYISLSDYNTLIETAVKTNFITQDQVESLKTWRDNPSVWGN